MERLVEVVQVRVDEDEYNRWRAQAEAEGRTLSAWVRLRCNAAVAAQGVTFERPPREVYVRASRPTISGAFVEPGVEFRDGDSFRELEHALYCLMVDGDPGHGEHSPERIAAPIEAAIKERWPDRAYFVEVHDSKGGWVQIFQPFGVPRNR
jgi:hypothetical protein